MRRRAAALLVAVGLIACAAPASAHPVDELLQQIYLTPGSDHATVDLEIVPGVLIAGAFTALVDTDGDGRISDHEARTHAEQVARSIRVFVDGTPTALSLGDVKYPDAALMAAGGGVVKITLTTRFDDAQRHTITVTDDYRPTRTGVQASVTPSISSPVTEMKVEHANSGRSMTATFLATSDAGPTADSATHTAPAPRLLTALQQPLTSPWALAGLFLVAAALGVLHALMPGHGKTLLAAYLVGERGTPRHAVALACGITVAHTASVIAIGLAVLAAGHYVVPATVVPALELAAGVGVVVVGARLALRRWRGGRAPHRAHGHDHVHSDRPVVAHHHSYGGSPMGWVMMSVSGGVVPCPEALGVLFLAVALHRTALGIGMIVAFSAGLAAVLVGIGLLLVTHRIGRWLRGRDEQVRGWSRWIPMASALVVTFLGIGLILRGASVLLVA